MSIPDLFQVQAATEDSDWGSAAAAMTVKLMGIDDCKLRPMIESEFLPELRASLAPGYISNVKRVQGSARLSGVLLYDDAPYWLDMLFGTATAVTDTESTRTYIAPLDIYGSDLASPRIMDIALGEVTTSDCQQINGATLRDITFKFEDGEPCTFEANFFGKEVVEGTLAAVSDRAVNVVMGDHVGLWIDPSSDAVGTTAISATAFSAELQINTNREPKFYLGSLTPSSYRDAKWDVRLRVNLELNATSRAYLSAQLGTSSDTFERVVRLKATSGVYVLQFDINGAALTVPELVDETDGISTLEFELTGKYHGTLGNYLAASSVNLTAAMA